MTFLRFLLAGYSLLVIFVSGGLYFRKRSQSYLMLSIFTFLFGLEIMIFLYATSSIVAHYPYFYGRFYIFNGFVYGPVLLFHFNAFIKNKSFTKLDVIHFLPLILVLISAAHYLILPAPERIQYLTDHFLDRIMAYNYIRALHILSYGIVFIWLIRKHYESLSPQKRLYSVSFCTLYFITAVIISWLTAFADGWRQFIYYYLAASTIFFLIAYILYKDPEFLKALTEKYLSSGLIKPDMVRIRQKVERAFRDDKIYLKGSLSIRELGELISENPHNISQTLSQELNENFNSYVNRFRIDHAKRLFQNPDFDHYKIEGIALESGFNNKATFNRAFKEFTGQTPSSFRSTHS